MLKLTCTTIALIALANPAIAGCATAVEASALKTAVLQQELMVAALQCHEAPAYNQFVLGYRGELQASDAALKAFFIKHGGEHGEAGYDTFKTKAANLSGLEQARDARAFCADAHALFAAAAASNGSLAQFVESRTAPLDVGALCREARPVLAAAEPARPAPKPMVVAAVVTKPAAPKLVQVAETRKTDSDVVGGVPEHARPANVWRREERAAPPPDTDDDDMDDVGPRSAAADQDDLPPPRARATPISQRSDGPDWHERARRAWAEQQRDGW